jgi:heme-degrading monooxygenase HmoA
MFVQIAIHKPKPGKAPELIESMHRFGAAAATQPGLRQVHTLQDQRTGELVGMAIWETKEAYLAARPAMIEAVKDDNFDDWEDDGPTVFHLEAV